MKRYKLVNLRCRGCAATMEEVLGSLPGVSGASIDFEESLLNMYGEEVKLDTILKVIRRIEPDVEVEEAIPEDDMAPENTQG